MRALHESLTDTHAIIDARARLQLLQKPRRQQVTGLPSIGQAGDQLVDDIAVQRIASTFERSVEMLRQSSISASLRSASYLSANVMRVLEPLVYSISTS